VGEGRHSQKREQSESCSKNPCAVHWKLNVGEMTTMSSPVPDTGGGGGGGGSGAGPGAGGAGGDSPQGAASCGQLQTPTNSSKTVPAGHSKGNFW